jgi:hypothetical protein
MLGERLYGVEEVRIGGARAPIVSRDDERVAVFVPDSARDGGVLVRSGKRVERFELDLIDDSDYSHEVT